MGIFKFDELQKKQARKIIDSVFNILIKKDASLVEINPLILNKSNKLCCLDAKINFDDNALFRHPEILKLRESFTHNKPIEWEKVHQLPDYVYFNHSRHVNSGVSCVTCHGRVDQMEVVRQEQPLSMSWCLDCHRNPAPNLRPRDKVKDLAWVSDVDPIQLGKRLQEHYNIYPKDTCSTCHF